MSQPTGEALSVPDRQSFVADVVRGYFEEQGYGSSALQSALTQTILDRFIVPEGEWDEARRSGTRYFDLTRTQKVINDYLARADQQFHFSTSESLNLGEIEAYVRGQIGSCDCGWPFSVIFG